MSCVGNPLAVSILFYVYHELHRDVGALADKIPAILLIGIFFQKWDGQGPLRQNSKPTEYYVLVY